MAGGRGAPLEFDPVALSKAAMETADTNSPPPRRSAAGPDELIAGGIKAVSYAQPQAAATEPELDEPLGVLASGMLVRAGFPCRCEVKPGEYRLVKIVTDDASAGMLIGRHGQTIDAVEHLVERMISTAAGDRVRMNLDINNYRRRRQDSLVDRVAQAVAEVQATGDDYHLDDLLRAAFEDEPGEGESVLQSIERMSGTRARILLKDVPDRETPVLRAPSRDEAEAARGDRRYQVLGEIARGGLGVVMKGYDADIGRDVAMKVLSKELATRPEVVQRFAIPKTLFDALLEGFAWDATGRRYADFGQLLDYAARVAGTVGAMMALLMGVRDRAMLARACDLGSAMQLTNIARDVGEDARNGRLYLPQDWLREAGVDPASLLARPAFTPALGRVVQRLLGEAERLYQRADSGIARLPSRCRPAMYAARLLYAEIGHEVQRRGFDSIAQRAVVSPLRKLQVLSGLVRLAGMPSPALDQPAQPATAFLVNAAAVSDTTAVGAWQGRHEGRLAWVLELFEDLERSERDAATAAAIDESVALAHETPAR